MLAPFVVDCGFIATLCNAFTDVIVTASPDVASSIESSDESVVFSVNEEEEASERGLRNPPIASVIEPVKSAAENQSLMMTCELVTVQERVSSAPPFFVPLQSLMATLVSGIEISLGSTTMSFPFCTSVFLVLKENEYITGVL